MDEVLYDATFVGLIPSIASLTAAVLLQRRQANATIYLELTARLFQLFHSLSLEVREMHMTGVVRSTELRTELSVAANEYFSVICSAYQLYQGRYFSGRPWRMLRRDIDRALKSPVRRGEWAKLKLEFASFPYVTHYVNGIQA